jgi:hypothetical protein
MHILFGPATLADHLPIEERLTYQLTDALNACLTSRKGESSCNRIE